MSQLYRTLTGQSQKSEHSQDQHLTPTPTSTPTTATLTKTTTTDPVSGVLNHLTEPQVQKLSEFKDRLQEEGWWRPDGVNGKPSHDEGTLLRYLRARKFDVEGAIGQFTDTEKWIKEQRVEELYEHFDVDIYERARLLYPQWTGHRDRRGIPIYVYLIKGLDSKHVSKYQKESQQYKDSLPNHKELDTPAKMLPLFALYHNLLNFVLPMVSTLERPHPEIPVTNSTNIVDISGVGLTQFWNLKNHMQDASVLATAHYPETLDRIFIIGAPSFFPTVWGWIKRWFDPVTVSKIFILSKHEMRPTLVKFMDPKDFPKKYGGELDWDWGQLPDLDAETRAALETDGNKGWMPGPCLWLDHQRVVVGSKHGKLRRAPEEIQAKKPIVYAADYTEEPVHPDRRASGTGGGANGKLDKTKPERLPSHHAINAAKIATAATVGGGATAAISSAKQSSRPTSKRQSKELDRPAPSPASAPAPTIQPSTGVSGAQNIKPENLRTAPMSDGPEYAVHVPPNQPPHLLMAEYVHTDKPHETLGNGSATPEIKVSVPEPKHSGPSVAAPAAPTPAITTTALIVNGDSTPSHPIASVHPSPPPGMTQPGPLPQHMVQTLKTVAGKIEGESTSIIPASADGTLPHPEVVVASDTSKGLALEKEKMEALTSSLGTENRPDMQRFVTAAEF